MESIIIISIAAFIFSVFGLRNAMISSFKIGYYEEKLKNRGVDISSVENITLRKILKL